MSRVDEVAAHARSALATYGHDRVELEWRLGHRQGSFRPGVDPAAWARLQKALEDSPAFARSYCETTEQLGVPAGAKRVCTAAGEVSWMHKRRLAGVDADARGPWCVRASLAEEQPADGEPAGFAPKYERRKLRWSYAHRCWRIDLTRARSNLPHQADEDRETHEVEVELADPGVLFERPLDNVVAWGWDIVDELCGLMEQPGPPR